MNDYGRYDSDKKRELIDMIEQEELLRGRLLQHEWHELEYTYGGLEFEEDGSK